MVHGNTFDVIGNSKVFIHDPKYQPGPDGKRYYLLSAGEQFDLKKRQKL